MLVVLAVVTTIAVWIGKVWFRRWFNPLSIYSAIWGFCLCNYELRLIQYEQITPMAWFYIGIAWFSLYLGSAAVLLLSIPQHFNAKAQAGFDLARLKTAIWFCSLIACVGVLGQIISVVRSFGITAVLLSPNEIYAARTANETTGVPYAGSFAFAACTLAGVHVAQFRRFTSTTLVPVILVALQLVFMMGRTGLGIAAVLFCVSFLYTARPTGAVLPRAQKLVGTIALSTLALSFILVSAIRGLEVDFAGITPAMQQISKYVPFAPSLYSNFSATPVAFSMYLQTPEEAKSGYWGMYTFAPVLRGASKLGFPTAIPAYEENYFTPVPMNTSTYLKNLYSDFGPSGIVLFPLALGVCVTGLIRRIQSRPKLLAIVLLSNIYVLLVFSFAFDFMLLGDWYIGAAASALAAIAIQKSRSKSPFRVQAERLAEA